jgi:hypothetical protein
VRKGLVALGLGAALALPASVSAKDEYSLQLCGRSGCKLVTDRIVAAALSQEVTDFGMPAPARVSAPFFTVRYLPREGVPISPTYRLPEAAIARTQATSSPEVAQIFERATAGIQPFSDARDAGLRWWPHGFAAFIGLAAMVALRRLRSLGGSNDHRGAVPTPVRDGRHQRHP